MSGTLADAKLIATARRDRAPLGSLPDGVVARDHSGVALRHDDFVSVGVECEIAVRLGRDLKPSDAPFTADTAAQPIEAYLCQ
jgi:hypothetical protein